MTIREYAHDDLKLLDHIKQLLGSDEWYAEHKQHLTRRKGKRFSLLFENDVLVDMCSVWRGTILDAHTMPEFRRRGYMKSLLSYVKDHYDHLLIGTSHEAIEKVALALGFKYRLNRGRYRYYEIAHEKGRD